MKYTFLIFPLCFSLLFASEEITLGEELSEEEYKETLEQEVLVFDDMETDDFDDSEDFDSE